MLLAVLLLFANTTVPMEAVLAEEEIPHEKLKFEPQEELVLNDEDFADSIEEIVFDDSDDDDND